MVNKQIMLAVMIGMSSVSIFAQNLSQVTKETDPGYTNQQQQMQVQVVAPGVSVSTSSDAPVSPQVSTQQPIKQSTIGIHPIKMPAVSILDEISAIDAEITKLNKQSELKAARQKASGASSELPTVVSLTDSEKDGMTVTVVYPNGLRRSLKVGDTVDGNFKIMEINKGSIKVGSKTEKTSLRFATKAEDHNAAMSTGSSGTNFNSGLPGVTLATGQRAR